MIIDQDIARGRQQHLEQRGQLEIPALPLRDLVIPLFLLVVRTVFLLYFFSPIEKPVFGILIGAWMFYEAWNAIRAAIVEAAHDELLKLFNMVQGNRSLILKLFLVLIVVIFLFVVVF